METLFPANVSPCFAEWANIRNISEKHKETSNVSEFAMKHFCFSGSKFCFRNNVSTGGQTWKHLRKHRESQMFPQQCFLVNFCSFIFLNWIKKVVAGIQILECCEMALLTCWDILLGEHKMVCGVK